MDDLFSDYDLPSILHKLREADKRYAEGIRYEVAVNGYVLIPGVLTMCIRTRTNGVADCSSITATFRMRIPFVS